MSDSTLGAIVLQGGYCDNLSCRNCPIQNCYGTTNEERLNLAKYYPHKNLEEKKESSERMFEELYGELEGYPKHIKDKIKEDFLRSVV